MNTIFWKGVFSTTIEGLLICELPTISKPPMRVKETTIDGRDGSIIEELGYSSYDKTITIGLRGNFNINKVIKYFTGEGEIIFSNEPDKVYTAKIVDQIDYNRLLRFRTAVVKFRVQPFKHKYLEAFKETPTEAITGTNIVVTPKEDDILKSFSIYGKTTQDGTPTPDSPVELVSVGASGSIAVTVTDAEGNTQTVAVQTPNGLHGIPVSSGGNYTDADGQQWICDEVDFKRGVYIQRVIKLDISEYSNWFTWGVSAYREGKTGFYHYIPNNPPYRDALCNILQYEQASWGGIAVGVMAVESSTTPYITVSVENSILADVDTNEDACASVATLLRESGAYMLITMQPIETPLAEEELALYNTLKSNNQTTILNDANADIKVEYFKPFEVFNEGLENSKPKMVLHGRGTVEISVNGIHIFDYTFPEGETEVVIDSEKEDAYLGDVLKNRNMNGEFPILLAGTNRIEWSGNVESIEILPRSRWL